MEDPVSKLHLLSFAGVREHLSQPFALESAVEHKQLGYSGIVDCVARLAVSSTENADDDVVFINWCNSKLRHLVHIDTTRYKDQLLLIDWKTAEREKNRVEDLYDNPIQVTFEP